ncbi:MAG: carboxylesterase family protein, partial [Erysipelotrichaceae bacterium]|nr:carboxylesterase family protein [Erysipelotrichaceae bacterium]
MRIIGWIIKVITMIVMFAVLELNKNSLFGWFLAFLTTAACFYFSGRYSGMKNVLLYLLWVLVFAGIVFLSWPKEKYVPAVEGKNPDKTEIVDTNYGKVQGVYNADHSVEVFAGIPYAKPPVGELRWKEPQKAEAWKDVLVADHFKAMAMQEKDLPIYSSIARIVGYHDYEVKLGDEHDFVADEDCLYLNLWRPADLQDKAPVLVYIHGGSLKNGQTWYRDFSGEGLAKDGIIVVNFAYRLGVFGFFANDELAKESEHHTTGNCGLLDMVEALKWVKENIACFGGDPDNITIAGESAGSAAVSALCTSPLAKGLFDKAVLESSTVAARIPTHSYRSYEEALRSGKHLMERYGVTSVEELRKIDAKDLVKEAESQHHITVDGYALIEDPCESYKKGIHNESAILHGYNSEESGPFILFDHANMKNYEEKIRRFFGAYADDVLKIYDAKSDEEADRYWAEIYGCIYFAYPHY